MRLIKCYVDNFGKLEHFQYDFVQGVNVIKEDNGWGKTTLATFIKAMLYGLPATKSPELDRNERKKYNPWNGGNFGGWLDFALGDKEYRVTRYFGKKEADDTFELTNLKTNKLSSDYTSDLGREIFGLDADGFERSCFIPQKVLNDDTNATLVSKLNNLINGTNDKESCATAVDRLKEASSSIKKKTNTGLLDEVEKQLDEIDRRIFELQNAEKSLKAIEDAVQDDNAEIDTLSSDMSDIKNKLNEMDKIEKAKANFETIQELKKSIEIIDKNLIQIAEIIGENNPTMLEVEGYKTKVKNLDGLTNQLQGINSQSVTKEYEELNNYFAVAKGVPEVKDVENMLGKYNSFRTVTTPMQSSKDGLKSNKILNCILPVIAVACFVGGALLISNSKTISYILFALGAIASLGFVWVSIVGYIGNKLASVNSINPVNNQVNSDAVEIENFVKIYEPNCSDVSVGLASIIGKIKMLEKCKNQMQEVEQKSANISGEIYNLASEIDEYLLGYNFDDNTLDRGQRLDELKDIIARRKALLEQKDINEKKLSQYSVEDISKIDNTKVEDVDNLLAKQGEIEAKLHEAIERRVGRLNTISSIQQNLCELNDLEAERDGLEIERKRLSQEYQAINKASNYLKSANEALSAKFLAPMTNAFNKYFTKVAGDKIKPVAMDTELKINYIEQGKNRELTTLSKGYRNTIDLCLRLALIDTLFEGEKPIVVLDDPFINMDEEKLNNAKTLLKALATDYQVIYFVCHNSRV